MDTEFHARIAHCFGNSLTATLMRALRDAVESEMVRAFREIDDWRSVVGRLVA